MGKIVEDISRTFQEYLLLPGRTTREHTTDRVDLKVPISKFSKGEEPKATLNIPLVSAAMQAVSGADLAVALSRKGGSAFIYCNQEISSQAAMVKGVKEHKAGFVTSDSNLSPDATLQDAIDLRTKTGHSTIAITEGGERDSKLVGLLTSKDFWEFKDDLTHSVTEHYTPLKDLVLAQEGVSLQEATELLWKNKKECLPIICEKGNLQALVFRRDYYDHKSNPDELTDDRKRLFVGAALNTFDYEERATALAEAGVDALCFDSSDGYTDYQRDAILAVREIVGSDIPIGGGNVVTADGFRYLVEEAGVDFVKVGIGGGSICITREQKGIGRGQASAVLEIAAERDLYFKETGTYIPICSDGGLNNDTHVILALAMGADFVMMGKYFAMTEESPTKKFTFKSRLYKPYWGEGSNRARNWQRYKDSDKPGGLVFEEGVDAYVPYSGTLSDKVDITITKLKATMCNTGVLSVKDFHENARLTRVSEMTVVEGGTSTVEQLDRVSSTGR